MRRVRTVVARSEGKAAIHTTRGSFGQFRGFSRTRSRSTATWSAAPRRVRQLANWTRLVARRPGAHRSRPHRGADPQRHAVGPGGRGRRARRRASRPGCPRLAARRCSSAAAVAWVVRGRRASPLRGDATRAATGWHPAGCSSPTSWPSNRARACAGSPTRSTASATSIPFVALAARIGRRPSRRRARTALRAAARVPARRRDGRRWPDRHRPGARAEHVSLRSGRRAARTTRARRPSRRVDPGRADRRGR